MKIIAKPKNHWGWVRLLGFISTAVVLVWIILAALLRQTGEIASLTWSGYQTFSVIRGLELAVVPLLAGLLGGWFEDQKHEFDTHTNNHKDNERRLEELREKGIQDLHASVEAALAGTRHGEVEIPEQTRIIIAELIQSAIQELDDKGKGDVIKYLHTKKLIEKSFPELTDVDFRGAILHNARLNNIHLGKASLAGAKIYGSHLAKSHLSGADLSKAFLRHTDLRGSALTGANLSGARLIDVDLESADLRDATFVGAFIMNCNLHNCTWNDLPQNGAASVPNALAQAVLIDTALANGRKFTNEQGKAYLKQKEYADIVDKL